MATLKLWQWQALDADSQLHEGTLLALSRHQAEQQLLAREWLVISLSRGKSVSRRCWQRREQILFLRQFAGLLHTGIPLTDAIQLLATQHPQVGWRVLLTEVAQRLMQGAALSLALAPWSWLFSPLTMALIRTGELTGKLDICCHELAERLAQQQQLADKTHKALRYPLFSLAFGLIVTGAMLGWVLPQFTAIYQSFNTPLPVLTRIVMALGDGVVAWGPSILGLAAIAGGVLVKIIQHRLEWQRRLQRSLLCLPLVCQLIRSAHLSQIYTMLALTQQSGIPLLSGLEMVAETQTQILWRQTMTTLRDNIATGNPFSSQVNDSRLFTPICRLLLKVGEESGQLDEMLARLAGWHTEQANRQADSLTALLSPLMMAITGSLIGLLLLAMYLPVFQLGDAMNMG